MSDRIALLCGGVGGAKLALGLDRVLPERALTIIVNTGDDFDHLGLRISPDIDTVLYTLAGLNDPVRGWGRHDETWHCMDALAAIGGDTWFALGDRDLALHLERTRRLSNGETLSSIVDHFARRLGVRSRVLPMSDDSVATIVHTNEGALAFQQYFVRRRCEPVVTGVSFDGALSAHGQPDACTALADPYLTAIVIAPSNPYLSIDPILAVRGIRSALAAATVPVIAVSPLVGGDAVKGPTAKMMRELGLPVSNAAIAAHYAGLIDVLVIDESDAGDASDVAAVERAGVRVAVTRTLMRDDSDKTRVARDVVALASVRQPAMADA